jgi:hypothetical protein
MISSLTPSEKNCISGSLDRFSKARTARRGSSKAAVRIDADASEEDRVDEDFPSFAYVRRNPLPIGETIRPASTTNATMPLSSDSFSAIQRSISLKLSIWPGSWSTAC